MGTRVATVAPNGTSARATGQLASLAYTDFVSPTVAIEVAGAILDADASSGTTQNAGAVTSLVFGLSYWPRALAITRSIRPFASAAVGPYLHLVSQASTYGSVVGSQSRLGARVGAGVSSSLTDHLVLQLETFYHAVGEFAAVNNVATDPHGFCFSVGFGFAWGSR